MSFYQRIPDRYSGDREFFARAEHLVLPGCDPDAGGISDDGGACGHAGGGRAQMAARTLRRGAALRAARGAGAGEPAGLRLAQRPLSGFYRAGTHRFSGRRQEVRSRDAQPAGCGGSDGRDGFDSGDRRRGHFTGITAEAGMVGGGVARKGLLRPAGGRAVRHRRRHPLVS